jgi:hypothetical protein
MEYEAEAVIQAAQKGHLGMLILLLTNGPSDHIRSRLHEIPREIIDGHPGIKTILAQLKDPRRALVLAHEFSVRPDLYLAIIARCGLQTVTFINPDGRTQPGVDAGGLTKQFICQLAEHLLLNNIIERDDRRFPCARQDDPTPYIQLGQLLSHIHTANRDKLDKLYIGEIFPLETYDLLRLMLTPAHASESPKARIGRECMAIANAIFRLSTPIQQRDYKELIDFLNVGCPTDAEITTIIDYFEACLIDLPEEISADTFREICFQKMEVQGCHKALSAILKGLSAPLKQAIFLHGANIGLDLQGSIDARLLEKLIVPQYAQTPNLMRKIQWLIEKITLELADQEKTWIKKFLKAVTSQAVMPSKYIKITRSLTPMCAAHTCTCHLELPIDDTTKEIFYERLELLISDESFLIR